MERVRGMLHILLLLLCVVNVFCRMDSPSNGNLTVKSDGEEDEAAKGTRWAVLIAGSAGWGNYRHQVTLNSSHP